MVKLVNQTIDGFPVNVSSEIEKSLLDSMSKNVTNSRNTLVKEGKNWRERLLREPVVVKTVTRLSQYVVFLYSGGRCKFLRAGLSEVIRGPGTGRPNTQGSP